MHACTRMHAHARTFTHTHTIQQTQHAHSLSLLIVPLHLCFLRLNDHTHLRLLTESIRDPIANMTKCIARIVQVLVHTTMLPLALLDNNFVRTKAKLFTTVDRAKLHTKHMNSQLRMAISFVPGQKYFMLSTTPKSVYCMQS